MYAPRYFALRYFAPRYFADGSDEPAPEGDGCYFADRYFARTYFAGRYFPCGDGETPDPDPDEVDCVLVCRTQCGVIYLSFTTTPGYGPAGIGSGNAKHGTGNASNKSGYSRRR